MGRISVQRLRNKRDYDVLRVKTFKHHWRRECKGEWDESGKTGRGQILMGLERKDLGLLNLCTVERARSVFFCLVLFFSAVLLRVMLSKKAK